MGRALDRIVGCQGCEFALPAPQYQRLASAAAAVRATGRSDHSIAVEFGVADRKVGRAIRSLGAAAVGSMQLTAQPGSLPPTGGTATLVATVLDGVQNPLPNVRVTFAATAGSLRDRVMSTDGAGEARTTLATTTSAEVTASVGQTSGTTSVSVEPPTAISITVTPPGRSPARWSPST